MLTVSRADRTDKENGICPSDADAQGTEAVSERKWGASMTGRRFSEAINEIDSRYIEEAVFYQKEKKRRRHFRHLSAAWAAVLLILILAAAAAVAFWQLRAR